MSNDENTHIYVDLDIINNDQRADVDPPQLRFEETRNAPYLPGDSRDYFCSILRFSIQTGNSLPIFIPRIQTGQEDPNRTVYAVTIRNPAANDERTVWLEFQTWNLAAKQPQTPTTKQDLSSEYYYVHSYEQFGQMVNRALRTCYYNLVQGYPDFAQEYTTLEPYLQFDPQTNLFALFAPQKIFDKSSWFLGSKQFELYFNTRLYQLLSAFPAKFSGNPGQKNYLINFDSSNGQNPIRSGASRWPYMMTLQEISTVATWNPVASIVFCTSLIPILPSNTSPPKLFGDNNTNLVSSGNNSNLTNILTDFEISVSESSQYRPFISYYPQSEYRLIDMNNMINLNKIDLLAFWKTHYGELIPLKLQPGCAAHLKILFRHRRFGESH
jgi:hypothetical protein